MTTRGTVRNRGISIAAAAVTAALVAPGISPIAPNALPTAHAQDAPAPAGDAAAPAGDTAAPAQAGKPTSTKPEPGAPANAAEAAKANTPAGTVLQDGTIFIDAISTGKTTKGVHFSNSLDEGRDVVSGRAAILVPDAKGTISSLSTRWQDLTPDEHVFFQWIDEDGAVSPVYSAGIHSDFPGAGGVGGDGKYAFDVPTWTDANGMEHKWMATNSRGYRIWSSANTNPITGNGIELLRQAGGLLPYTFANPAGIKPKEGDEAADDIEDLPEDEERETIPSDGGRGSAIGEVAGAAGGALRNGNLQNTGLWYREKTPDYMRSQNVIEDNLGPIDGNINTTDTTGDAERPNHISGMVWLEDGKGQDSPTRAVRRMPGNWDQGAAGYTVHATFLTPEGFEAAKALHQLEPKARAEATKQMVEEHPEYLAATYVAPVDEDGQYTLRVSNEHWGDISRQDTYIYMWVQNPEGRVVPTYNNFTQPVFTSPIGNLAWNPAAPPSSQTRGAGPTSQYWGSGGLKRWTAVNHAIALSNFVELDITNFNSTDKPWSDGDEPAKLEVKGDVYSPNANIEWRRYNPQNPDQYGQDEAREFEVVKTCEAVSIAGEAANSQLKGCETFAPGVDDKQFGTPEEGTVYQAVAIVDGREIAFDSFVVAGSDQAKTTDPEWKDTGTKPGEAVDVPNTGDPLPDGTKVEVPADNNGWKAEVNPDGSTIKVTPPADAKPGDSVEIPVTVTYPDGSVDDEKLRVTVNAGYKVEYDEAKGQPDSDIKATPKSVGDDPLPEGTKYAPGDKKETHDGLWDISDPDVTTGEVTGKASWDKLKQRYLDERKNTLGDDECVPGESFSDDDVKAIIDKLKPLFSAQSTVDATYTEAIKQDEIPVNFTLVDKNGTPLADSNDWDGDGVDNETEIKECKNPLDPNDQNDKPIADQTTPDWNDASATPGEPVDVPNDGDKLPEGSTVTVPPEVDGWKVELLPDGETIQVTPPADAEDDAEITVPVEVTYSDGSKDTDEFKVTIGDKAPDWDDKTTTPNTPVDLPNTGGPVKDGTSLEVEGPGTAELKPDGTITVTPNDDAKPGDKIVVTVKDPDGNKVDEVTVTIKDPNNPDWDDTTTEPKKPVKIPNTGGPVKDGTTVEVEGPGKAVLNPDGSITVTPSDDAKPGDKIVVTVKDPEGNEIDKVTVTVGEDTTPDSSDGPSSKLTEDERNRCIAVSVGFGLPLIALVPIGLALSASIPGLTPVVEQVSNQIQRANSELQRQLGVFNPEAARMSAQLDATLRQFGLSTAQVGSALAALVIGITASASIASACTPGGGSSIDSIEGAAQGGSAQLGSSNRGNRNGSSVKTSTARPSADANPADK